MVTFCSSSTTFLDVHLIDLPSLLVSHFERSLPLATGRTYLHGSVMIHYSFVGESEKFIYRTDLSGDNIINSEMENELLQNLVAFAEAEYRRFMEDVGKHMKNVVPSISQVYLSEFMN